jgi:hypothetical protein
VKLPQAIKHRKVESAVHRSHKNKEYYHNNSFVEGYSTSILQPINNKGNRRNDVKAPKSEKSNVKHFSFIGTPLKNNQRLEEDERKPNFLKLYLPPKPGTSSANGSFRKEKFRLHPQNLSSKKNNKQLNLDISNFEESSIFEDSTPYVYNDKENHKNGQKEEWPSLSPQHNRFVDVERENEVQRLKEEIKRLQVTFINNFIKLKRKDNDSQLKIAELHLQLENQNKEWSMRVEATVIS